MEFLDKIGDFFVSLIAVIEKFITRLFGASNERQIRRLGFERRGTQVSVRPGSLLDRIAKLEPELQKLSDDELKQTATRLRARLAKGETLDDLLPDAFAAARESGLRYLKMRHYDVQMIGGYVLHQGTIAEMVTGEGKTLVATLPAVLNALAGSVHVVTVNDYLARRDMEWMAPLYMGLGLTVGAIQAQMSNAEKREAYNLDITYGTNNEFGFDYLRDNMKPSASQQVQGPLVYAIVDEIDNILIDEARTPLIISGPAEDDVEKYRKANRVALQLQKDVHFEIKEKEHTCHLTEEGIRLAEQVAGVDSFYTAGNMEWPHLLDNALKAHHLYKRDVNYVVMEGEIIIVDEFTGRLMKGRQWSDGLHQAVEAKEGVKVKEENQTLATITLQNYFKLYKKLCGMTGTAMTEATEFWKIYKLDVMAVPTNRPMARVNYPDVIYRSEPEKYQAIINEIRDIHATGRPILVGTTSIEKSELISHKLDNLGIKHETLNAKHHEREADIVAQAGRLGAVTIATNMAGRGTDIILGGNPEQMAWDELKHTYSSRLEVPKAEWNALSAKIAADEGMEAEGDQVAELGGLHVIGTERHEARRIDLQLRGRSGRQGDPGSSRFFLSLEDDLMRIFAGDWVKDMLTRLGMQEGEAIESRLVSRRIEGAQKKVEERHFEMRKNLLEYDEVMDLQRKRVYSYRQHILEGGDCRELILKMSREMIEQGVKDLLDPNYGLTTIVQWSAHELGIEINVADLHNMDVEQVKEFLRDESIRAADDLVREKLEEDLPEEVEDERDWNFVALSRWANTRWGLNTNDRELRKLGRDDVGDYLLERAREAVEHADLEAVDHFMSEGRGRESLCGWLQSHFTLEIDPDSLAQLSNDEAVQLIFKQVDELYNQKEITFPVSVGLSRFLSESQNQGARYDREGLAQWANGRFGLDLPLDEFNGKSRSDIQYFLIECSRKFNVSGEALSKVGETLDQAYGHLNGEDPGTVKIRRTEPLTELARWANERLRMPLDPEEFKSLSRAQAEVKLLEGVEGRYRPELRNAELSLILEVLDTSWKDHLYYMDHLRQGIGLVGYAQQDPKVEYKREGRKAFDSMWKRISDQVTGSIFRMEEASPEFVSSLWVITSMTHDEPTSVVETSVGESSSDVESASSNDIRGSGPAAIEPIRNQRERVGRNDLCPCGSGKKFKNCHMRR